MKKITLICTLALGGMVLVSPLSTTAVNASEDIVATTLVGESTTGILLSDGEELSDHGETFIDDEGAEFFVDSEGRMTASVRTWSGFRSAVNNVNVAVINVTSSFNSSSSSLNKVNRSLTINFINNATINVNNNHSLQIGYGGHVTFTSHSTYPIIINNNQVRQPYVQGDMGSSISFNGNVVVGNLTTRVRQQPFIRTSGLVQVNSGSNIILNEAIEANQLNVINYGSLTIDSDYLSPVQITQNGRLNVSELSTFRAGHAGNNAVVQLLGAGQFIVDNPYHIHLVQTGTGAITSPLVYSLGAHIQINAIRNAFWTNNNYGWSPTQAWGDRLQAQLTGANGSEILSSNIESFEDNFLGFNAYRQYTAGTGADVFPDTYPSTPD